jgi:hypothetical protein
MPKTTKRTAKRRTAVKRGPATKRAPIVAYVSRGNGEPPRPRDRRVIPFRVRPSHWKTRDLFRFLRRVLQELPSPRVPARESVTCFFQYYYEGTKISISDEYGRWMIVHPQFHVPRLALAAMFATADTWGNLNVRTPLVERRLVKAAFVGAGKLERRLGGAR